VRLLCSARRCDEPFYVAQGAVVSHFMFVFRKSCLFRDDAEKCGRAGETKDYNIVRNKRIACWIPKAANTNSEYVMLIASTPQQWLR
jgi:hypothetical protein